MKQLLLYEYFDRIWSDHSEVRYEQFFFFDVEWNQILMVIKLREVKFAFKHYHPKIAQCNELHEHIYPIFDGWFINSTQMKQAIYSISSLMIKRCKLY